MSSLVIQCWNGETLLLSAITLDEHALLAKYIVPCMSDSQTHESDRGILRPTKIRANNI